MDAATKFRDDLILRAALNETLDLFGDENKKIMIDMLAMMHQYGSRKTSFRDNNGFLVYEKITEYIQQVFGSDAAIPILRHLDAKVTEHHVRLSSQKKISLEG